MKSSVRKQWAALVAISLVGCGYAREETVLSLQHDIAELKDQNDKQQKQMEALRKAKKESEDKLRALVEEATKVVTRNSADLGQDVDKLKENMSIVNGRLDEVSSGLASLTKTFDDASAKFDTQIEKLTNATNAAKHPPIPETADGVFAEAQARMAAQQYNDARRLLDAFISRYATDKRAAQAQFLIGESYFAEKKYANAINAYTKVNDNYGKSDVVPDAMYKNGLAFYALKYCGDARIYFQELLRRYPRTKWKKEAKAQLHKLAKDLKNKDLCQS